MYKINLRDEAGLITSKEFNNLDAAEDFYITAQFEGNYIEMQLLNNNEVIDHCYAIGSKLKPIWLGE